MSLKDKKIIIGVTGGIAAYKACEVARYFKRLNADVHIVMSKNATEFVTPLTFETLTNNRVTVDSFDRNFAFDVKHISLAKNADLFLVVPCTANFAAKLAGGIADDFISTTAMAMTCPILLAPAMNTNMYNSIAYQENEKKLRDRGVYFVQPDCGMLACGDVGKGRLADIDEITSAAYSLLTFKGDLSGKTVLVTAGATREKLDPVRYITNYSSGKMGFAIAAAAVSRGAKVILISGFTTAQMPYVQKSVKVETTEDMFLAVKENLESADIIIKAAAPADYKPDYESDKIKSKTLSVNFSKNPDIAEYVGKNKKDKKLIVFAAETNSLLENATKKLKKKNADMVVANDVLKEGAGFNTDTNIVTLISNRLTTELPLMDKTKLADVILDEILLL